MPLHEHGRLRALAVQQQAIAVDENEKVSQPLALWGQERRPYGTARLALLHVVGDKALQEGNPVRAADRDHPARRKQGYVRCHARQVGSRARSGKACRDRLMTPPPP